MTDTPRDQQPADDATVEWSDLIERFRQVCSKADSADKIPDVDTFLESVAPAVSSDELKEQLRAIKNQYADPAGKSTVLGNQAQWDSSANTATIIGGNDTVIEDAPEQAQIPGYEIVSVLGRGGMGVVYLARQAGLNRLVALKMIIGGEHADQDRLQRFLAEAEAVAQLQHPNIVQIYEVGRHQGLPYFSLEYVSGQPLDRKVAGDPIPQRDAAELVKTIATAMAFAHERNIVHRDLKPANILLTEDGIPKVTDFGLAKQLEKDSAQTRTGTVLGTPRYMAPEQARGDRELGPLVDVYAMGAILYELLTGRPPFMGASVYDTLMQVQNDEPVPPSRLQPTVTADLETICLKCIQKDPQRRYANAAELAADLQRFLEHRPILARPVGTAERLSRWCRRNPWIASMLASIFVLLTTIAVGATVAAVRIDGALSEVTKQKDRADEAAAQALEAKDEAVANEKEALRQKQLAEQNAEAARAAEVLASKQRNNAIDVIKSIVYDISQRLIDRPAMAPLRRELLGTAIKSLDSLNDLAKESGGQEEILAAAAFRRLGDVYMEMGQIQTARDNYQRCYEILELLHAKGELSFVEDNLSKCLNFIGEAELRLGNTEAARERFTEALTVRQNWLKNPDKKVDDFWINQNIASSYGLLGKTHLVSGNPGAAFGNLSKELEYRQQWIDARPDSLDGQGTYAGCNLLLGDICVELGRLDDAKSYYHVALDILQDKLSESPATIQSARGNVGLTYGKLAEIELLQGRIQEAADLYRRGATLFEQLVSEDAFNATMKRNLALLYTGLGYSLKQLNDPEWKSITDESMALRQELFDADPSDVRGQTDLMHALARSGKYKESAELAEKLRPEAALDSRLQFHLGCCLSLVAAAADEDENAPDELAATYAQQSIEALRTAINSGYRGKAKLTADPDLAYIRNLDGFAELIAELDAYLGSAATNDETGNDSTGNE